MCVSRAATACVIGICSIAGMASGDSLDLDLSSTPDLFSGFIDVTYDAGADLLAASGYAFSFDDDGIGAAPEVMDGTFSILATIDETGASSGGTLEVFGAIPELGIGSGLLLSGVLSDFGFPGAGSDPLEFLFAVTGGELASYFGGTAGVILGASGFMGDFLGDWNNLIIDIPGTGSGVADLGVPTAIPLPAHMGVMAFAPLLFRRRR